MFFSLQLYINTYNYINLLIVNKNMKIKDLNSNKVDLNNYLIEKWINSSNYIEKLWFREENEDTWEIIWVFISWYINEILCENKYKKIVWWNENLVEELIEISDANELFNDDSKNILYVDFSIKAEDVILECNKSSELIMKVISVFEIDKNNKKLLDEKSIVYYEM